MVEHSAENLLSPHQLIRGANVEHKRGQFAHRDVCKTAITKRSYNDAGLVWQANDPADAVIWPVNFAIFFAFKRNFARLNAFQ